MNTQNFFLELLQRLLTKNPKFFRIIQIICLVLGFLSAGLTHLIDQHVQLPVFVSWLQNATVQVIAFVTLVMAQLPNQSPSQKR